MDERIFSRCTYKVLCAGMEAPESRAYILRCGCSPHDALFEVVDELRFGAPDECEVRTTSKKIRVTDGDMSDNIWLEHIIEYVDQSGSVVFRAFDIASDAQNYSMNYLLNHPELLPDNDVDLFKKVYERHYR